MAKTAKDREVIHLVSGQDTTRMIAFVETDRGAVYDVIGVARFVIDALKHLNAGTMIGAEAEIVRLVVASLIRHAIGVVLVRWKTGAKYIRTGDVHDVRFPSAKSRAT